MVSAIFNGYCPSPTTVRLLPPSRLAPRHGSYLHFCPCFSLSFTFPNPPSSSSFHSPSFPTLVSVSAAMATESSAKIIDGKAVAQQIREEISVEVSRMKEAVDLVPGLAVILIGDRKDSATYVHNKKKACDSVGINSYEMHLPENSSEEQVLDSISSFNADP